MAANDKWKHSNRKLRETKTKVKVNENESKHRQNVTDSKYILSQIDAVVSAFGSKANVSIHLFMSLGGLLKH